MIKRIIGLLAAAATIAIVVATILHRYQYRSMVDYAAGVARPQVGQAPQAPRTPQAIPALPDSTQVCSPRAEEEGTEE